MNEETTTMADNVRYLPGSRPTGTEVVEAELVPEAEYRQVVSQRERAAMRRAVYRQDAVTVARGVRTAVTHEHTRTAVRQVVYFGAGATLVGKRIWDGRTVARYERMMRAAEIQGNHEAALEWEDRASRFRKERHQRRMDLLAAPQQLAKGLATGAGIAGGSLLALGIILAAAEKRLAEVAAPFETVIDLVKWVVIVGGLVWGWAVAASLVTVILTCWAIGRKHAELPAVLAPAAVRQADHTGDPITPSIVVTALRDLGVAELRKQIRAMPDNGAGMLGMIQAAGCGIELDVYLPSGVDTGQVVERRRRLAENLGRHEHELYISIPPRARTVRLWVADSGALDEPIGPSPLVTAPDTAATFRTGRAPWGQDLRGDAVTLKLYQCMVLITGLSNQGKTASLRALALWAVLDSCVEFRIADLKGVGDWAMFDGLASVLIQGPTDEHVIATTHMVEEAVAEMRRRITLMQQLTAQGWNEERIMADSRFHPLVVVIDEAQVAYGSGAVGLDRRPYGGSKNTSRYFQAIKAIHDQGRVVNVTTWEGTQDPTNDNLPKRSREGNHIRASLVLGTESQAQMALGEAAVAAGAAPHKLRQGIDKGTLVATGEGVPLSAGQSSLVIRTHYIGGQDAGRITERAKARRRGQITTRTLETIEAVRDRDLLADLAEVIGTEEGRVMVNDLPALLREFVPDHEPYRGMTGKALRESLDTLNVRVYTTDGRPQIEALDIHMAITQRDVAVDDDA